MKGLKSLVGQEYRGRKEERVEQVEAGEGGSHLPRATWAMLRMGGGGEPYLKRVMGSPFRILNRPETNA